MTRHLFIGGPADGEWRDVEHAYERWLVTEWPYEVRATPYDPVVDGLVIGKEHMYIRRYWRDDDSQTIHTFYVHSDTDNRHVFGLLVAGYRKPKADR